MFRAVSVLWVMWVIRLPSAGQNHVSNLKHFWSYPSFNHFVVFALAQPKPIVNDDPCYPSPCGPNSQCHNGQCTCIVEYQGDPYVGCRPECVLNADCPRNRACVRHKCVDPCPGTCAPNAICDVLNHIAMCHCPAGMAGNAFIQCETPLVQYSPPVNPCAPSPCGPNSRCRVLNDNAVCSCLEDYVGTPPSCRPECTRNSDCLPRLACQQQHCIDPCPGTCGYNALCHVVNHAPICSCPPRHIGNPFLGCQPEPQRDVAVKKQPCQPSPCGPYAECRAVGDQAQCSCLPTYIGTPPNCRPECVTNSECSFDKACVRQKCVDPCPGACGANSMCHVLSHTAMCYCTPGYTEIPSPTATRHPYNKSNPYSPVILILVEPMPCAVRKAAPVPVSVCLNIMAILTRSVDPSVSRTTIAHRISPVNSSSVAILAQVSVAPMQPVGCSTIFPPVIA